MSERKVLTKYYPPDFDPSKITRTRRPLGESAGAKVQTVRLMAPFSMKCLACGEYIYKGRKFNARKEVTEQRYYAIPIFRFYIRCTRCSGEITFKTDPKNMDYECERGAKRNFEIWRQGDGGEKETDEERLDRLEREQEEKTAMEELEAKVVDAKQEIAVADALDEIRTRNARNERARGKEVDAAVGLEERLMEEERRRVEAEDAERARRAFTTEEGEKVRRIIGDEEEKKGGEEEKREMAPPPVPMFQKTVKKKKDFGAALGIKKKAALV
ncbi:MAG: hypothetical protein LQ351_005342 [Letrouitia transgressa]|nr:MAG: hypothetical protein LQ351_005342 [Letrouitia transgressa]